MKRRKDHKPSLTNLANAAFEQACRKVLAQARQTGTPVVLWKDGRVEKVPVDEIELPTRDDRPTDGNA